MTIRLRQYSVTQSPLYQLRSKRRLAELLRLTPSELRKLLRDRRYSVWTETNEKGKTRTIENPAPQLKRVQRRIAKFLGRIQPDPALYCPVKGRSYVSNAKCHADSRVIETLDIKKYFPNTTANRVSWFWHRWMNCSPDVAMTLTKLCTYDGHLPTGSPLSPVMAYLAHIDMWQSVANIARDAGCVLTIYVDDVTISGDRVSGEVLWKIKKEIYAVGLRYHKQKKYTSGWAEVTGVIVSDKMAMLPNRQHLKIHETRKALCSAVSDEEREFLSRRLKGLTTQARQIAAVNARN